MKLWIARDDDGTLVLYDRQPYLPKDGYNYFDCDKDTNIYYLDRNMFPEVTVKNSPQEVELKLVEK